jgi:dTDP-4-amino-4,6-dideoxygalactose transaminase
MDIMIPFYKMENVNGSILEELIAKSTEVIKSNNFVFGTDKFEEEFANWNGNKYCVAVATGTAALHVALMSLGIGPGDEVITVSHTFRATVSAIRYCGAVPVFVDINPNTFTMDPTTLESKINNKTKAILPVHIYGNMCDMDAIMQIANKHNIPVIEDSSQSHGSEYGNKKSGTFGKIGTFSFYPGKGLGALGDAGCIVTDDQNIAEFASKIRTWDSNSIGYNYRMSNMQAEFLRVKLRHFDNILDEKISIGKEYNKVFNWCKTYDNVKHSYHVYPILVKNRDKFVQQIKNSVETKVHYDTPVHKFLAHMQEVSLPITERIANEEVSLPMYPGVDYKRVIDIINDNISSFL